MDFKAVSCGLTTRRREQKVNTELWALSSLTKPNEGKKGQDLESTREESSGKLLQLCGRLLQAMHLEKGQAKMEHTMGKQWPIFIGLAWFLSSLQACLKSQMQ